MLHSFLDKTIEVVVGTGKVIIWIGRKILESVLFLTRNFPNTTFGMVFGTVIFILVSSIPIIGWLIGGLAAIQVLGWGVMEDFKAMADDPRIVNACSRFRSLRTN